MPVAWKSCIDALNAKGLDVVMYRLRSLTIRVRSVKCIVHDQTTHRDRYCGFVTFDYLAQDTAQARGLVLRYEGDILIRVFLRDSPVQKERTIMCSIASTIINEVY